jgi:DNA-binding NtrC family response regulator
MMMPEMNGLDLIERLRALDPAVAIIMSTGYATPEVASACSARAVQLLRKPCDLDELRLAIRRVFAGAAGERRALAGTLGVGITGRPSPARTEKS